MMTLANSPRFSEEQDADVAEYRSLSGAAIGGLILGLLSPTALVDPVVWCVPFAGILVNVYALWRIRRNPTELTGRKAALWGLWLSVCFAAAAPADLLCYRYRICQEAKRYTAFWFDLLAEGRPERAFQLLLPPKSRQPLDDRLWEYYRNNPEERYKLEHYVAPAKEGEKPSAVRTLLALGKSAAVQYLDAPIITKDGAVDLVYLRYAVTYDDAGAKKTFLLIVQLLRTKGDDGSTVWRINGCGSPENKPKSE
jgi:hypothetical protein